MRLKTAAIIATVCVMVAGLAMISPLFFRADGVVPEEVEPEQIEPEQIEPEQIEPEQVEPEEVEPEEIVPEPVEPKQRVMLSFSISQRDNVTDWCKILASILKDYDIGASVFVVGKVAEQYPQCVLYFSDKVDIGSQTYSNVNLTDNTDYELKLEEVGRGKKAVDGAGRLISRAFLAPFGATDEDIYSLLSRSGILADFSYSNQYNLYEIGQFIKYDAAIYKGRDYTPDFFLKLTWTDEPIIINFDNTYSIFSLKAFISKLHEGNIEFINASELAGFALTTR